MQARLVPQHLPSLWLSISPSVLYNAGDYAEGRGCPSGLLALSTYKGVIEMFKVSELTRAGLLMGDRVGRPGSKGPGRGGWGGRGRS